MKLTFKMTGIAKAMKGLDKSAVRKKLKANMKRATALNGKMAESVARNVIKSGKFEKNAPLTVAIKDSEKPLVDDAGLFNSITSKVIDPETVFVGVLKTDPSVDIATAVHEGVEIKVTPQMRGLFFVLWQASTGQLPPSKLTGRAAELYDDFQEWKPIANSTKAIIVPSRPFMRKAFRVKKLRTMAKKNWSAAIQKTFADIAKESK